MTFVKKFRHVSSDDVADVIGIHGEMVRLRWADGVEDEYHIKHIQKLVQEGHWEIEE